MKRRTRNGCPPPPDLPGRELRRILRSNHPAALVGLELEAAALRRALTGAEALRDLVGAARALASYWVALEVACARGRDEPISQKQLAARAHGVWSQATISRAIQDLTRAGLLSIKENPRDRRSPFLTTADDLDEAFRLRGEATRAIVSQVEAARPSEER